MKLRDNLPQDYCYPCWTDYLTLFFVEIKVFYHDLKCFKPIHTIEKSALLIFINLLGFSRGTEV